jgi:hypothetical protein
MRGSSSGACARTSGSAAPVATAIIGAGAGVAPPIIMPGMTVMRLGTTAISCVTRMQE